MVNYWKSIREMCGLLLWIGEHQKPKPKDLLPQLLRRGPDQTSIKDEDNFFLVHTRLAISHSSEMQPKSYENNNFIVAFNGEIYNQPKVNFGSLSEVDYIYHLYKQHSVNFAKHLDGEYSIIIIDKIERIATVTRDYFGTKPLFIWSDGKNLACSSVSDQVYSLASKYETQGKALRADPQIADTNTTSVIDIDKLKLIQKIKLFQPNYNLCNENTNVQITYEEWKKSLYASYINRWPASQNVFIPLSSGHDSGLLAALALKFGYRPVFYCIPRGENLDILHQRINRLLNQKMEVILIDMQESNLPMIKQYLDENTDHVTEIDSSIRRVDVVRDDPASIGAATILKHAKDKNLRVMFSGQGGDEIYSGYGAYGTRDNTSRFQLKYNNTTTVQEYFPWINLEGGKMHQFLMKEEVIASNFSIETRYPFLCTNTLRKYLKFKIADIADYYKGPIEILLKEEGFPVDMSRVKRGFNPYSMDRSQEFMNLYKDITITSSAIWPK